MKKIIYILTILFFITGCGNINNTPTRQVEELFNKYQTLDKEVLNDLDQVIGREKKFNEEQSNKYRDLIKKQYKNLTYKIKEETVDGDTAVVTTEITVLNLGKIKNEVEDYKNNHIEEFADEDGNYSEDKYINYLLLNLKEAKEKVKYTIDIRLTKIDKKWKIDGIDSDTEDKILGIYEK